MWATKYTLAPVLALLGTGCLQTEAVALVDIKSQSSALQLSAGDKLLGSYFGCYWHSNNDPWTVIIGSDPQPGQTGIGVQRGDTTCQIWLHNIQRVVGGNTENYRFYSQFDLTKPARILIQEDYNVQSAVVAVRESDSLPVTMLNIYGSGLDFMGATFKIHVATSQSSDELQNAEVGSTVDTGEEQ